LKNWKIAKKLIATCLVIAVLAAVVGVVGIIGSQTLASSGKAVNRGGTLASTGGLLLAVMHEQRVSLRGAALQSLLGDIDAAKTELAALDDQSTRGTQYYNTLDSTIETEQGRALYNKMLSARTDYATQKTAYVKAVETTYEMTDIQQQGKVIRAAMESFNPSLNAYIDTIDAFVDFQLENAQTLSDSMTSTSNVVLVALIVVLIIAVVVALLLATYISGLISKPLKAVQSWLTQAGETGDLNFTEAQWAQCSQLGQTSDEIGLMCRAFDKFMRKVVYYGEMLNSIAERDLTKKIDTLGDKDTLGNALATMRRELNAMLGEIKISGEQVQTGSAQIADGAQSLASGATEQAATVEELSSTIAEVSQKTQENAKMADDAANLSNSIRTSAQKGSEQMDAMLQAVREINEASANINQVIKVIDNIAFQTNILALNAAVEAARAGSAGKGFAVVAEEVRSLAAKSAEAASDTSALIESSMEKASLGKQIASETSESLTQIVEGINETSQIVEVIASGASQAATAISQINIGINQVSQVVQSNSATSQESAASAEEMSGQSALLAELIAQFELANAKPRGIGSGKRSGARALPAAKSSTASGIGNGSGSLGKY